MSESRGILDADQQFCSSCGQIINKSAAFCNSCGTTIAKDNASQSYSKKPSSIFRVIWIIGSLLIPILGFVVGIIYLFFRGRRRYAGMLMGLGVVSIIVWSVIGASESGTTQTYPKMTHAQIKAEAQNVSYDSLYRYNERYVGKIIVFNGTIIQVQGANRNFVLRVNMNDDYDQTVYVHYSGSRVLENDNIKIWGRVSGLKTYEALFGNSITIPEIEELISVVN